MGGLVLFTDCIKSLGSVASSLFMASVPAVTAVLANLMLGEALSPLQLAGIGLCSAALVHHALRRTPENARLQLAAVVEFIHTATLLHDDVVDESPMRRGRSTANASDRAPGISSAEDTFAIPFDEPARAGLTNTGSPSASSLPRSSRSSPRCGCWRSSRSSRRSYSSPTSAFVVYRSR